MYVGQQSHHVLVTYTARASESDCDGSNLTAGSELILIVTLCLLFCRPLIFFLVDVLVKHRVV